MRRIVAFATAAVMILASAASSFGADYTDVKQGNWAFDAVNAISERTIVKGYPDGSFKPNNTVTYGEFIKMALIADTGVDAGNAASGHWALNYYNKALESKYFTPYDIDKSQLGDKITRSDMALIISSILGDVKIDNYDRIQAGIGDITYQTPHEYDITKAYAYGILTGYSDKTFKPNRTLSRAESATVIYRLVDESKRVLPGGEEQEGNKKPIDEVITNLKSFYTENGSYDDFLAKTETYSFVEGSMYGLTLANNELIKWFIVPAAVSDDFRLVYLMKDGKIIESLRKIGLDDGSKYELYQSDIATVDYIVSVDSYKHALIISNPFKKS